MTHEEIIRMAEQSYLWPICGHDHNLLTSVRDFAALIAAAERKACAQVCEGHYDTAQAARSIRTRKEK